MQKADKQAMLLTLKGIYKQGKIELEQPINISQPVEVLVIFLDKPEKETNQTTGIDKFSFLKSMQISDRYNISLSESLIEERRQER